MKKFISTFLTTIFLASGGYAFWDVQNSGEDVFGNVNVTATSVGDNGNLIRFECGSSSEPFFAFLLRDSSGDIPEIPAEFLHIDQAGKRHIADAVLQSWNEKFVAVRVTDVEALRRIAEHMIVAKKSIPVGVTILSSDYKKSDTFSPRGSTTAGKALLQHCVVKPKKEEIPKTKDTVAAEKDVVYYRGVVVGVWEACLSENLPENTGHLLDLMSTAVYDTHLVHYNEANSNSHSRGIDEAKKQVADSGCAVAAQSAISGLPEKY